MVADVLIDALLDSIRLISFLFFAYLLMEAVEHRSSERMQNTLKRMGKLGPFIASLLGCVPQCGFSASAASLYSAGIISCGTLISVFISTSDEAIPILISSAEGRGVILPLIICKVIIAVVAGFLIDFVLKKTKFIKEKNDLCKYCGCSHEGSIIKPALWHTVHIFVFIFIINSILNFSIEFLGEENIANLLLNGSVLQPFILAAFGLIPNCATSVVITQLYLSHSLSVGATIAGLCANGGTGLAVLLKTNKSKLENIKIILLLYGISAVFGVLLHLILN